jgi:hypothetical protein
MLVRNAAGLPCADEEAASMPTTKGTYPAVPWTHKLNSEEKQAREYSNLLQEFKYAVQRQDEMMMKYCTCELKRMFRDRGP